MHANWKKLFGSNSHVLRLITWLDSPLFCEGKYIYSIGIILEEIIQTTHVKLPHVHKIIKRCTSEHPIQRYTSTDEIIHLLHSKNKYLPYLSVLLITILTTGGLLLGYHWGLKQNSKHHSQSINIYNQIVQQTQHITKLRCQKLYDRYDSITTEDSLSLWLNEYSNLIQEIYQQIDSILKQNMWPGISSIQDNLKQTWEKYLDRLL